MSSVDACVSLAFTPLSIVGPSTGTVFGGIRASPKCDFNVCGMPTNAVSLVALSFVWKPLVLRILHLLSELVEHVQSKPLAIFTLVLTIPFFPFDFCAYAVHHFTFLSVDFVMFGSSSAASCLSASHGRDGRGCI